MWYLECLSQDVNAYVFLHVSVLLSSENSYRDVIFSSKVIFNTWEQYIFYQKLNKKYS